MRPIVRLLIFTAVLALASQLAASGLSARGASGLVTATVPQGQTVADLRNQLFVQNLTCSQACDATTWVSISAKDARQLGFKGGGSSVAVASSYVRLKPNKSTKVGFVLTKDGKTLLRKAKAGLHVSGRVTTFSTTKRSVHASTGWHVTLK
jgi:hypothetical protein